MRGLDWQALFGSWVVRLLAVTWRFREVNGDASVHALRRAGQTVAFALWHGELLPLLYHHRRQGVAVLISEHRDGELIARIAQRFGFRTVRGSTSRGASRALVGLVRELEQGHDVAVTPDGPRGPAHSFAPGALIAAQRARVPVIPVRASATRAWRLRSWDRFLIPKPFSRITIAYGMPVRPAGETAREAAGQVPIFEQLMSDLGEMADA